MNRIGSGPPRDSGSKLKNSVAAILIAVGAWLLTIWTSRTTTDPSRTPIKRRERATPRKDDPEEPYPFCVIGIFSEEQATFEAAKSVRAEWSNEYRVYSPNLNESLFEALELPKSGTRMWILIGAVIGQLGGWATTIMLSIYYPHRVASMPVIAIPPFAIVSFEMMVLFGVGVGFLAVLFYCRLPEAEVPPDIFRQFKKDRFGVVLMCDDRDQVTRAQTLLERHKVESIAYA
jgi:Protein of unknown function (DUF3341)